MKTLIGRAILCCCLAWLFACDGGLIDGRGHDASTALSDAGPPQTPDAAVALSDAGPPTTPDAAVALSDAGAPMTPDAGVALSDAGPPQNPDAGVALSDAGAPQNPDAAIALSDAGVPMTPDAAPLTPDAGVPPDQGLPPVCVPSLEVCDGKDNDCNGAVDDGCTVIGSAYYVAPNGSDGNPGTLTRPWRTIGKAANTITEGETVFIRDGVYNETVYFGSSGTASQPINVLAYPEERPVIDGNQHSLPTTSWTPLVKVAGDHVNVSGLEVRYSNWGGVVLTGRHVTASYIYSHHNMENGIIAQGDHDIVEDCDVYYNAQSNEYFIQTRDFWASGLSAARHPQHVILRRNKVWNNWGEGLSTFEAEYTILEDNIVYDNKLNVYLSDTSGGILRRNLVYCTDGNDLYTNIQVGIAVGDEVQWDSSDNQILNNIVVGCSRNLWQWGGTGFVNSLVAYNTFVNSVVNANVQIDTAPHQNSVFTNNLVLQENTLPVIVLGSVGGVSFSNNCWSKTPASGSAGSGDVVGDPLLAKTGTLAPGQLTADFGKLLVGSPAIGQGVALPDITEDFFGTPRGTSPDIGAHQHSP